MSSKSDVRKIMAFCKHMREAIIDEQKAVPDYLKLIRQAKDLVMLTTDARINVEDVVESIIKDEQRHKSELIPLFDSICPRMAFHREGINGGSGITVRHAGKRKRIYRPRHHRRAMEGYGR